jgi:hypothetical protein
METGSALNKGRHAAPLHSQCSEIQLTTRYLRPPCEDDKARSNIVLGIAFGIAPAPALPRQAPHSRRKLGLHREIGTQLRCNRAGSRPNERLRLLIISADHSRVARCLPTSCPSIAAPPPRSHNASWWLRLAAGQMPSLRDLRQHSASEHIRRLGTRRYGNLRPRSKVVHAAAPTLRRLTCLS